MPEKDTKVNAEMAPYIATNHNFYHHKQSKISREQFQNAKEKVAEPLLINNKLN